MHQDGTVQLGKELLYRATVLGDDTVGVLRVMGADVGNRIINAVHLLGRDDGIQVFPPPIIRICGDHSVGARQATFGANFDPGCRERGQHLCTKRRCNIAMDQETFSSTTNSGAAGLCVQHDIQRLLRICSLVEVDMHNPLQMRKDRHTGFTLDETDQPLATTGHDHIHRVRHGQQALHRCTVPRWHQLHCILRQIGRAQPFDETAVNGLAGVKAL